MPPSKSLPEVRSCGVLVTLGDPIDRFLLMRHKDRWDLPKGHVDPGESDMETALREMVEETGFRSMRLRSIRSFGSNINTKSAKPAAAANRS